ncbi:coatomer protein complex subunit alpha [Cryptosporidium ryanae]|uniref:coatomer protein complex subunit alpha n=1 Tax=Cryptosporidium ryanae TaxID=515981 RepID=UPI00351A2F34|nr:coatomer protein complex subunit alpha [Cryptosporidium ryanae]
MIIKCESKSTRAKGLSFHPKLPWILVSLHNGVIQFWDYRIGSLLDTFEEHEGPVRGIDFHESQPIFVSGGDDYRVKVWNYKERKCLFTLLGHLDYIRTVEFHKEYPWILSSSDDQTMRLWNWQSRTCIAVITGHNHYVMCSRFHPHQDLLASASMDQTVRIWDFTGLREKTVKGHALNVSGSMIPISHTMPAHVDMFGANDVLCKFVLEGHERGVNWVSFHPTLSLLASASDDRTIKLWRYNDIKAWEIDTLRGHFNNVSCVIFHTNKDWLLSDSEDRTIRVWDLSKRTCIHTYRRDSDRFWTIVNHPSNGLFSAGHDSGMIIFKLEQERLPSDFSTSMNQLWYINDRFLYLYDVKEKNTHSVLPMKSNNISVNLLSPSHIFINPHSPNELCFIVYYKRDMFNGNSSANNNAGVGSNSIGNNNIGNNVGAGNSSNSNNSMQFTYDIITINSLSQLINNTSGNNCTNSNNNAAFRCKNGIPGVNSVIFLSRNRLAALENSGQTISIISLDGDIMKRWELPWIAQRLFMGGNQQQIIIQSDDFLYLYDVSQKEVISELVISNLQNHQVAVINNKYGNNMQQCLTFSNLNSSDGSYSSMGVRTIQWSHDKSVIAIICKYNMIFTNNRLQILATYTENLTIKSGIWHETLPIYIYSTQGHIKYAIPNINEYGIIQTVPDTTYIQHYEDSRKELITLNRYGNIQIIDDLNLNEALFKLSIINQENGKVLRYTKDGNLKGLSTLNYLTQNGYPEIAIQLVENPILKFYYSVQFGEIIQAFNIIKDLHNAESGKENNEYNNSSINCNHKTILPKLNSKTLEVMWECLGRSAISHGFVNVAEKCFQITKEFDKLILLYYVIGQREYMEKIAKISEKQKNWTRKYHIALLLNDIPGRINILKEFGQLPLAIAVAHTYGYKDIKEELLSQYSEIYSVDGTDVFEFLNLLKNNVSSSSMIPSCIPIVTAKKLTTEGLNWPTIYVQDESSNYGINDNDYSSIGATMNYSNNVNDNSMSGGATGAVSSSSFQPEWDDIDIIDIPNDVISLDENEDNNNYEYNVDNMNDGVFDINNSKYTSSNINNKTIQIGANYRERILISPENLPAASSRYSIINLIISERYYDAITILSKKMGAKNCLPYKEVFKMISLSSTYSLPSFSDGPILNAPLLSENYKLFDRDNASSSTHLSPMSIFDENSMVELVKIGQKYVTSGKFKLALEVFQKAILIIPLVIEHYTFYSLRVDQLKQLSLLINQYCIGMRLELARIDLLSNSQNQDDPEIVKRNLELISYFSCCKLQPLHSSLVLRRAMSISWKYQNYITTASFAKRLLGMPNIDDVEKTQKILSACDKKATDEYNIDFEPNRDIDNLVICSSSLTKINPKVHDFVKCPVCNSNHLSKFTGEICPNCNAGEVGLRVIGII